MAFPKDHGPHPGYRTEWWYYTGNLQDEDGYRYGFQLTFFRVQISPDIAERQWPARPSAWRTNQIYFAHAAVSDANGNRHLQAELAAREALDMAGSSRGAEGMVISLGSWQATIGDRQHVLVAHANDFGFQLKLTPTKPPVFHGKNGYSRKGTAAGRASCYYSFTRLQTEGILRINAKQLKVRGLSWMDHEYSTAPLAAGIVGWDWFSLQLSDQTDIMLFLLRQVDGQIHPVSSGSYVDAIGNRQHLKRDDYSIKVRDYWRSPATRVRYPSAWRIRIPELGLDLNLVPMLLDQEMQTRETTGVVYWEGSISIEGVRQDRPIQGAGYVEMTGYAGAFDAPM